jgi:hypothetical protein
MRQGISGAAEIHPYPGLPKCVKRPFIRMLKRPYKTIVVLGELPALLNHLHRIQRVSLSIGSCCSSGSLLPGHLLPPLLTMLHMVHALARNSLLGFQSSASSPRILPFTLQRNKCDRVLCSRRDRSLVLISLSAENTRSASALACGMHSMAVISWLSDEGSEL